MKAIAIQIGPLAIHWYSLMILAAIVLGTKLGALSAKHAGEDPEHVYDMALYCAFFGILGARLYYVALSWNYYASRPLEILATWHGGLAIHGGIIGGITTLIVYCYRHKLSFWKFADILAPCLILGQAIGRWGNFFNNEAYGAPAIAPQWFPWNLHGFLPWGIQIPGEFRMPQYADLSQFPLNTLFHPTFLYESLWNLGVFTLLFFLLRRSRVLKGNIFFGYLALYSVGRFFIEGLRTDPLLIFGTFRMAQMVSLSLIIASAGILLVRWILSRRSVAPSA